MEDTDELREVDPTAMETSFPLPSMPRRREWMGRRHPSSLPVLSPPPVDVEFDEDFPATDVETGGVDNGEDFPTADVEASGVAVGVSGSTTSMGNSADGPHGVDDPESGGDLRPDWGC